MRGFLSPRACAFGINGIDGGHGSTVVEATAAVFNRLRFLQEKCRMADIDVTTQTVIPREGLITLTHIIYGLHAFSALTGLSSAAFIVTAFLTGWPSIIAVILNYVKRDDVRGTFLDSHFSWQIRTFWFAVLWFVVAWLLIVTIVGVVIGFPLMILVGIWVLYRIVRGWIALVSGRPLPMPA
jgi:uncharacterized membrane protein